MHVCFSLYLHEWDGPHAAHVAHFRYVVDELLEQQQPQAVRTVTRVDVAVCRLVACNSQDRSLNLIAQN